MQLFYLPLSAHGTAMLTMPTVRYEMCLFCSLLTLSLTLPKLYFCFEEGRATQSLGFPTLLYSLKRYNWVEG